MDKYRTCHWQVLYLYFVNIFVVMFCQNIPPLIDIIIRIIYGSEVENMLLVEYDYETDIAVQREEAWEEGMEK